MEELKLPYKLEWFDRDEEGLAPEEYRALHTVGTAPIIKDGDLVMSESTAIVEYISQRHGNGSLSVQPQDPEYPHYLFWMQFNNNAQWFFILRRTLEGQEEKAENKQLVTVVNRREDGYYQYLDERLCEAEFLAGDRFTCADIMSAFNLTTMPQFGARKIDDLPNVAAYVDRITSRPAYQKAMEIAGPAAKRPSPG